MKALKQSILPLLLLLPALLHAQQAMRVTLHVTPRPDPYISEWAARRETAMLVITNPGGKAVDVKLDVRVLLNGSLTAQTKLDQTRTLTIQPGVNTYYADEIIPFNSVTITGDNQSRTAQTGMLPAGTYEFCVTLVDPMNTRKALSGQVCRPFTVTAYQNPILLLPANGTTLAAGMRPTFRWTPVTPKPPYTVLYKLRVMEILPGQTPTQAFRVNRPILENEQATVTQLLYPAADQLPEQGKRYVWNVQALNERTGLPVTESGGYAEPFSFSVATARSVKPPDTINPFRLPKPVPDTTFLNTHRNYADIKTDTSNHTYPLSLYLADIKDSSIRTIRLTVIKPDGKKFRSGIQKVESEINVSAGGNILVITPGPAPLGFVGFRGKTLFRFNVDATGLVTFRVDYLKNPGIRADSQTIAVNIPTPPPPPPPKKDPVFSVKIIINPKDKLYPLHLNLTPDKAAQVTVRRVRLIALDTTKLSAWTSKAPVKATGSSALDVTGKYLPAKPETTVVRFHVHTIPTASFRVELYDNAGKKVYSKNNIYLTLPDSLFRAAPLPVPPDTSAIAQDTSAKALRDTSAPRATQTVSARIVIDTTIPGNPYRLLLDTNQRADIHSIRLTSRNSTLIVSCKPQDSVQFILSDDSTGLQLTWQPGLFPAGANLHIADFQSTRTKNLSFIVEFLNSADSVVATQELIVPVPPPPPTPTPASTPWTAIIAICAVLGVGGSGVWLYRLRAAARKTASYSKEEKKKKQAALTGIITVRFSDAYAYVHADDIVEFTANCGLTAAYTILKKIGELPSRRGIRSLSIDQLKEIEQKSGVQGHSLAAYWKLDLREKSAAISNLINLLAAAPGVEEIYQDADVSDPQEATGYPPGSVNDADDPYATLQLYLGPHGVNARAAWKMSYSGHGVGFIDLEQSWNPFINTGPIHEDLVAKNTHLLLNANQPFGDTPFHGTSVLGVVAAVDNNLGIVGIAPNVEYSHLASHYDPQWKINGDVGNAIMEAYQHMNHGDVLLLEVQTNLLPVELRSSFEFTAIRLVTHHAQKSIVVIEAAGNGGACLDSLISEDSGAIVVGSCSVQPGGTTTGHRKNSSNYGARVDCYAWGERIFTTGKSKKDGEWTGFDGDRPDTAGYTDNFNGTSGASAILAGAAIIVQGAYKARHGAALTSMELRRVLSSPDTGKPCATGQGIGVMPDLEKILAVL